jgi:hypothetical protein
MMATKLNAQVTIKNLQNMHKKSLPPTGARRRMEVKSRSSALTFTTCLHNAFWVQ